MDDGSNQGDAWRTAGFDDHAWKTGRGLFGYGGGNESTAISYGSDPANKPITTYFRKTFTTYAELDTLEMRLLYNDGAVVWINGLRLPVNILPFATIAYNTRASSEVVGQGDVNYQMVPGLLTPGLNLIAVEIHKYTNNGARMSFDMQMDATGIFQPTAVLTEPLAGAALAAGQSVRLSATVSVPYGRATEVAFFADDVRVGQAVVPPFSADWAGAAPGSHKVTALVTTDNGMTTKLGPVWIVVGRPSLLGVGAVNGGLQFAWPSPADGYVLESATNLTLGGWLPVTNGLGISNGLNQVTLPLDSADRFFRLRK
jgi:hypothetical protein